MIEIPLSRTTDNDLQGRLKVALEIPLSQKWQLTWSEEGRVKQNMGKMDVILSAMTTETLAARWTQKTEHSEEEGT